MKFGVCASIDKADLIHDAGFDFIECTVGSLKPEAPETEVVQTMNQFAESPIPVAAFNVLLPQDLKVVGPTVDQERARRYLRTAFQRIETVGGRTVVFGSGRSRVVPEGFDPAEADKQLAWFLQTLAEVAEPRNITVVIEPLNKEESNAINTVQEAHDWAKRIGHPSIRALADWYHMRKDGESADALITYRDQLAHLHIAGLERYAPAIGDDCDTFAASARAAGYDGTISVECRWKDIAMEINDVSLYLRKLFS